jgi:DNA-binding beta-propeller fold protein YncE
LPIGTGEEPVAVRLLPDGKTLAVANSKGNSVSLIDPATGHARGLSMVAPAPATYVILPDSSKAFVACSGGHQVMVIALATRQSAGHGSCIRPSPTAWKR